MKSLLIVGVMAIVAMAGQTRTALNLTAHGDPTMVRDQITNVLPFEYNKLCKDVDTLFSRTSGLYAGVQSLDTLSVTTIKQPIVHISATTTLTNANHYVFADASDSATNVMQIALPAVAGCHGKVFILKNISDGDSGIIINPNASETIDGQTVDTLITKNSYLNIVGDTIGTDSWRVW